MGKKKPDPKSSTSRGSSDEIASASHKRAGMQIDMLEPRILLSGTWVEVAAIAEAAPIEASIEEAPAWGAANNFVYGTEGNDWLKGSDDDDVLAGLQGDDVLYGGDGNDRFVYRDGDGVDQNIGGAGEDQIDATRATSLILDEIHEKYSIESIVGSEKGLDIEGTESNNYLDFSTITLKNVSQIDGGAGDDVIIGSAGDEVILAGVGNDVLDGGKGDNDLMVMSGKVWDYKINEQPDGTISISDMRGLEGDDRATGFESFQFGDRTFNRDELLKVASNPDELKELEFWDDARFMEQLQSEFDAGSLVEGTGETDYLKGSERDDVFVGLRNNDVLYGGSGNDRFVYRQGDGVDVPIGGQGDDVIDATRATSLQLNEIHQKYSVEYIVGSENGLTIEGTKENNYLDFSTVTLKNVSQIDGGAGDDVVIGSAGDDVILAGAGNDFLDGGKGEKDLLVLSGNVWDYKVNEQPDGTISISDVRGREGDDRAVGFEYFQFNNRTLSRDELLKVASNPDVMREYMLRDNALFIEQLRSESSFGFTIEGTEASERLKGTSGDDVFLGREGDDDLYGSDGDDRFVYREGDGLDRNVGGNGFDTIDATQARTLQLSEIHEKYSIESIIGGRMGLTIEGTKENDYLDFTKTTLKNVSAIDAGYGDDVVLGSSGDDVILAGAGNDVLSGGEGENDVLVLSGNRSEYKIGELSFESLVIADRRGIDGEDQVTGFEQYRFADQTVSRDELFNQAPTGIKLDGGLVSEDAGSGVVVGKLYAVDADRDDSHTFRIVDEKGNAVDDSTFAIKDNVLVVRDGQALDYETSSNQTLRVQVTDAAGSSCVQEISIRVEDANDAPTAIILKGGSVSESAESGTVVGELYTVDADGDDSQTYELVDANGNGLKDSSFAIKDNAIVLREGNSLDYETASSQTLFVKSTDKAGASHTEVIRIHVNDANDAPTAILLDSGSVSESSETGTVVGKLSTVDVDRNDSHTYQLVDEKGNLVDDANFVMKDNAIVLREGSLLDYEANSTQTVFVKTTDKGGSFHIEAIRIAINDANDAPTAIELVGGSVSESAAAGTVVAKLSTADADLSDQHTYQIVDGNGNAVSDSNFEIKGDAIVVRDGSSLDYESRSTRALVVKATDQAGTSFTEAIRISVTDANDAPTAITLDGGSVSESGTAGTVVGKLSTADADQGDSHTYQIVDSNGNIVANSNFAIKDNAIVVRDGSSLDYESSSTQTVFVKATDRAGASQIEQFTIQIDDANEAPIAVAGMVATSEDASVVVPLNGIEIDSGDSIALVRIEQLPAHWQLLLNGFPIEPGKGILYSDVNSDGLIFIPDKDWHGDTQLSFSVFDGESWSDTSAGFTIHVEAVADEASLTMEPARGLVGETIPLQLSAKTLDLDGSEHLTLRIAGLPEGATLNAGIRQLDGTWLLGSPDLSSLSLTLPQGQAQQFVLAITATTTEDNGSTSTTSGSLHVTVDAPVSIVPDTTPTTGQPNQAFNNTISDNSPRQIEHVASVAEFTTEVPTRESASLTERPLDDFRPVGDMFVTIRPLSIDWTEAKFGDVQEITFVDRAESQSDQSSSRAPLIADNQSLMKTATTNINAESASGFVWMWSAVRALTGMRDDRKNQ